MNIMITGSFATHYDFIQIFFTYRYQKASLNEKEAFPDTP